MNDSGKSSASPVGQLSPGLAMARENRRLREELAALRLSIGEDQQAGRDHAGQMQMLREANQHLVLASFSASDQQAIAELANERQTVFLSMLAHELRNPIESITFANTVMRGLDVDNPKLDKLIDIVSRQSSHMVRLVDDLLDVARIRTGKLTLEFHDTTLGDIMEAALATAQPALAQRSQAVTLEMPGTIRMRADQVRLAQLFSNLLVNASKFSPPHTTVHVSAQLLDATVAITIRDEGRGIAPQDAARMFDLFEQGAGEGGHALSGGLGIGLSLVRSIATMHGGTVNVARAGRGQGCAFTVVLPLGLHAVRHAPAGQVAAGQ